MFHRDFYPILIEVACGLAVALTMSYAVYDDVKRSKSESRIAKEASTLDLTTEKKDTKDLEVVADDGEEDGEKEDNDGDYERDTEHDSDDNSNRMDVDNGADSGDDDSSLRTLSEREEDSEEAAEEPEQEEESEYVEEEPEQEQEQEQEQEPVEHEKVVEESESEEQDEEQTETHSATSESLSIEATAYTAYCDTGCTGTTATGVDVSSDIYHEGKRVIAVSPDQIPLGSDVEVELNDGTVIEAVAEDTGGDIGYGRLDLLVESEEEAYQFGRQSVEVRIIN